MPTNIGTGPEDIPLNQHLGELAFQDKHATSFFRVLPSNPSTGVVGECYFNTIDNTLKVYDGSNWIGIGGEDGSANAPFTSIANAFAAGVSNGLLYFQNDNVNSGNAFQLRYASYGGRGWVETLWSSDSDKDTPWDNWLDTSLTRPVMQNYNNSSGGLNYSSGDSSFVKLHSSFNLVDFAVTSKSSVTGNGLTATGANQGGVLPLVASDDLDGSGAAGCRLALAAYFGGYGEGFSVGGSSNNDYVATWSKTGSNNITGPFEIHLAYRSGAQSNDEWHICDGNTSVGTTYAPNIGYRDEAADYGEANVGSWSTSSAGKGSTYTIDSSNVLSCWVTDSL